MSFAMDDLSRSYGIDSALQTKLAEEARTAEKTNNTKATDSAVKEPVVNDVFEASSQKPDTAQSSSENIQSQSTAIDITNESLNKIASLVTDIKTNVEKGNTEEVSGQKINENYDKINQIAKETSFNGTSLIKATDDNTKNASDSKTETVSLAEIKVSDIKNLETATTEQQDKSVKKLNDIIDNIKTKEQDLNDKKEKLAQSVNKNSLVEIKRSSSTATEEDTEKSDEASAEKLKNTTIKNINEAPSKSIKMHIRHLDKNLLLAMLSLRGA